MRLPAPMLPSLAAEPFDSDEWLFELKWDGVRAICAVERDRVVAVSRTGHDLMPQFPELADLRRSFKELPVIIDGEIVSLDAKGRSSFQRLQPRINRIRRGADVPDVSVSFAAFDLLGRGRVDLRDRTLDARKSLLSEILLEGKGPAFHSKHVRGSGKRLFNEASRHGVEGIVAKRLDSPYRSGRSRDWLKIKAIRRQEFVIGGWTEPKGSRSHVGALLLGFYEDGRLRYAGHVGTGFDEPTLAALAKQLRPLETKRSPFSSVPETNSPAHWARPKLVAEIKFGEWTRDGILRQPVYLGLRADKRPEEIVREVASVARSRKRGKTSA